jgi:hypothetical protein
VAKVVVADHREKEVEQTAQLVKDTRSTTIVPALKVSRSN